MIAALLTAETKHQAGHSLLHILQGVVEACQKLDNSSIKKYSSKRGSGMSPRQGVCIFPAVQELTVLKVMLMPDRSKQLCGVHNCTWLIDAALALLQQLAVLLLCEAAA